jgi:hydroxyethylthiazole kinase-like uncharacterized protein yjeF
MSLPLQYQPLQKRAPDSHKGNYGHVVIVGGNIGYMGSICLAGIASLRTGAGLVSLITHPEHASLPPTIHPELMSHSDAGLATLGAKANVLIIGPGLGQDDWATALYEKATNYPIPIIIDADALHLLHRFPKHHGNWVLTPHPGEAAILLDTTPEYIQAHREESVIKIQKRYGGICVLKGHRTLVSDGHTTHVCPFGNPGMASAGMGDVLTGIIAALIGQGLTLFEAAQQGVVLHAMAGDMVAKQHGEIGMIASDIVTIMQALINHKS